MVLPWIGPIHGLDWVQVLELSCWVISLMLSIYVCRWVWWFIVIIGTTVCWVVVRAYPIACEVLDSFKFTASSLNEEIIVVLSKLIIWSNRCIAVMTQCECLAKCTIFNLTSITRDASSLRHRGICRGSPCLWPSFHMLAFEGLSSHVGCIIIFFFLLSQ